MNSIEHCFLIDDDTDDQEIFCMALQDFNKNIQCNMASNGIEAVKKLSDNSNYLPDIIFIDMNMPKINGLQCLIEIRKIKRLINVPIIIYSTSSNPETVVSAMKEGAQDFLIKPPAISELSRKLQAIFVSFEN